MKGITKMKSAEFIALSACTMTLTALGIDIMLPVFAELRVYFGLKPESTAASQIIVFFFMGQVAQIIFGTLSDRYGRLAILRLGFPLYIIGGIVAAYSPTLELMCAARFVAGMGASAVFMITIAGVRDRFVGDEMARIMSLIFTIFLFTPIFAPFLGIAILSISNWRMVFLTPPLVAVIVFLWSLRLEESLPKEKRIPLKWKNIGNSIKTVISNTVFLRYMFATTFLFTGLSSYVASSEHIIGEIYGKPKLFPWIFGGMGAIMSFCALMNSRLTTKLGARRSIRLLLSIYVCTAALFFIYSLTGAAPPLMFIFFTGITILMALNIAIEPNSSALALEPMGEMAGTASSVYGTCFFFIGSTLGSIISQLMVRSVFPLVISFLILGVLSFILVFTDRRPITFKR